LNKPSTGLCFLCIFCKSNADHHIKSVLSAEILTGTLTGDKMNLTDTKQYQMYYSTNKKLYFLDSLILSDTH